MFDKYKKLNFDSGSTFQRASVQQSPLQNVKYILHDVDTYM